MWWHGADMCDVEGVIKTVANKDKVVFTFFTYKEAEIARDYLHSVIIDYSYYMDKTRDKAYEVTIWAGRLLAATNNIFADSDSYLPNDGCGGTRRVKIRGFGLLLLSRDSIDQSWFVEEIQLQPREHMYIWESGAYFWHDWLPALAESCNMDLEMLRYRFASQCSFNDLNIGV